MTSNIINLNKVRKARARAIREADAETNRIKFGRTRQQKAADKVEPGKLDSTLDGARRDPSDIDQDV